MPTAPSALSPEKAAGSEGCLLPSGLFGFQTTPVLRSRRAAFCSLGDAPCLCEGRGEAQAAADVGASAESGRRLGLCRRQTARAEGGFPPPSCLSARRCAEILRSSQNQTTLPLWRWPVSRLSPRGDFYFCYPRRAGVSHCPRWFLIRPA